MSLTLNPENVDAASISDPQPTTMQTVDGGDVEFQRRISKSAIGKASHINDFDLTIRGIADGDPVGLETFDLGFFKDGTPSIIIQGAHVPIRHDQWMSLMNARDRARHALKQEMEFRMQQQEATKSVSAVLSAMPSAPAGMQQLFLAKAQLDPIGAVDDLSTLYLNYQKDGGRGLHSKLAGDVLSARIKPELDRLTRKRGKGTKLVKGAIPELDKEVEIDLPSIIEEQGQKWGAANDLHSQTTSYAFGRIADMFPNPDLKAAYPEIQYGVFDRMVNEESDNTSPMSLYDRLRHLAANGQGVWPTQIPLRDPSAAQLDTGSAEVHPFDTAKHHEFIRYLQDLDQWAVSAFGWDQSTPEALDRILLDQMNHQTQRLMQSTPATTTDKPEQARTRPSAL